jgi:Leucine-rich repeat (LRR) protein
MSISFLSNFSISNFFLQEQNNIDGTIPTEMGLLSMLTIWGMERGKLSSTIPTEIGKLTNLIFIDFDFNELTGSLTSELLSLSSLTQLDLNDNMLTGSINGIGVFPNMTFLQLHGNAFTGTVPESIGTFSNLGAFTLHESNISGTMPTSVCNLRPSSNLGGKLSSLIADCTEPNPNIICDCCSDCRRPIVGGL